MSERTFWLMDANVLLDYCSSDINVLALVGRHLGKVCVPSVVLAEVRELDAAKCELYGIHVMEPTLEQVQEAMCKRGGPLSLQDLVCFVMCRDHGWICVSNDRKLRAKCEHEDISVCWGLELLIRLAEGRYLDITAALHTAEKIWRSNPYFINDKVMESFRRQLELIE